MSWSFDISSAPLDRKLWLATKCGKVTTSAWIDGKGAQGRWAGLATKELPIAWQEFVTPDHPGAAADYGAIENHLILDDCGSGA